MLVRCMNHVSIDAHDLLNEVALSNERPKSNECSGTAAIRAVCPGAVNAVCHVDHVVPTFRVVHVSAYEPAYLLSMMEFISTNRTSVVRTIEDDRNDLWYWFWCWHWWRCCNSYWCWCWCVSLWLIAVVSLLVLSLLSELIHKINRLSDHTN